MRLLKTVRAHAPPQFCSSVLARLRDDYIHMFFLPLTCKSSLLTTDGFTKRLLTTDGLIRRLTYVASPRLTLHGITSYKSQSLPPLSPLAFVMDYDYVLYVL